MRFRTVLALPLLFAAAACGSLASHTDKPSALATVHGQVTNPDAVSVDQTGFRVAVVWTALPPDGGTNVAHVAQETPVTPVFPAQFSLDIDEPPPADTIITTSKPDTPTRVAYGALVAYEDRNGNGKLDLVDLNAMSFVDRIVAASPALTIMYIESLPTDADSLQKIKDDNGASPTLGFNLFLRDDCKGGCSGSKPGFTWLPVTSAITLKITNDPQLSSLMCATEANGSGGTGAVNVRPAGQYPSSFPAKGDPNVVCGPDNRSYIYMQCTQSRQGLCDEVSMSCDDTRYDVPDGQNPPAGWPCGQ